MKKILNFFRSKNKKNILLSLFLAFSIFLSVGLTALPTKKASAAISGNIYDYAWANYFDFAGVDVSAFPPDTTGLSEFSYVADYSAQTIKCTLKEPFDGSYFSFYVDFIASPFDVSLTVTPDVLDNTIYSFFADCYCSFAFDSAQVSLSVGYVNEFTNAVVYPIYDSFRLGSYSYGYDYYDFPSSGDTDASYFLYSIRVDIYSSESLSLGDYVLLSNIGLYQGKTPYSYTDYFYDLTDLPNPLPLPLYPDLVTPDDSESEDSSSEDSGSDDDSSGGIIPPPEMEGDYLDGYLAGLSQAYYGYFSNASVKLHRYGHSASSGMSMIDILPQKIYGGFNFSNIPIDYAEETSVSYYGSFTIEIRFAIPIPYSVFHLNGSGVSSVFTNLWTAFSTDNVGYRLTWNKLGSADNANMYSSQLSDSSGGVLIDNVNDLLIESITTSSLPLIDYCDGLSVTMTDFSYQNGYDFGYYEGEKDGYADGVRDGLNDNQQDIYDAGHRAGYDDGFAHGYSENNSFLGLFTAAIDAPVITFTSMLDFNVLGYNLKSVVLSILSIALVVCLVRLFAKGGSS